MQLAGPFHAPEDVEPALDDSLRKLGVDYLDLYLIHLCVPPILRLRPRFLALRSPIAVKKGTTDQVDEALTANPYPTWKKLEEMVDKGKVRNIGVSKYVRSVPVSSVCAEALAIASTSPVCAT